MIPVVRWVSPASLLFFGFAAAVLAQEDRVDEETLPRLLEARGFQAPEGFKAYVVELEPDGEGGFEEHRYDWRGTSTDRESWWPASTIKIYAAVAAIERIHALGFPLRTSVTYHYEDEEGEPDAVTNRLDHVVRLAIERSNNQAFDRLVELAGLDYMNQRFFVEENGFTNTVFRRAYTGRHRDQATGWATSRHSPPITLRFGQQELELPERHGRTDYDCPDEGNCTTLRELAECMRRVMMHEQLPEGERYDLREEDLRVLRAAMDEAHNYRIAEIFEEGFGEVPVQVWHKPGYAYRWVSDVLFVHRRDTGERWVVAMAARPGRRALDGAAEHVAAVLRSRLLRRVRQQRGAR